MFLPLSETYYEKQWQKDKSGIQNTFSKCDHADNPETCVKVCI